MAPLALDHLVIGATTLQEGVAWCEATLGITPGPGGRHALMSTHNRLFAIGSPAFPRAYAEIIAIDPQAPPPGRSRWFDLDQPALQRALAHGPALIHWVARVPDLAVPIAALAALGHDAGEVLSAQRDTPQGLLRWRIGVRRDGRRSMGGALPTFISWGDRHPADDLEDSGVRIESLTLSGVPREIAGRLAWPAAITMSPGDPALQARLATPKGRLDLGSPA